MPLNLELKARVESLGTIRETAQRAGAEERGTMRQTDTYFRVQHGRLKLREIEGKEAELISYERGEEEQARWSRYEKTPASDPSRLRTILCAAIGELVTVRKTREVFLLEGNRIHLDTVEGLGTFIEIEIPAEDEEPVRIQMDRLRSLFGISGSDVFLHSYSDMLLGVPEGSSKVGSAEVRSPKGEGA